MLHYMINHGHNIHLLFQHRTPDYVPSTVLVTRDPVWEAHNVNR